MDNQSSTVEETSERSRYFQNVQVWPLSEDLNYEGWLKNFDEGSDRDLAANMLDFFTHYSEKMVIHLLITSVSNSGYCFEKEITGWTHDDFTARCYYSFIPGETENPTDSGHIFTRYLRDKMGVPETRIKSYNSLGDLLNSSTAPIPVIFVDDFVGSGSQIVKAWSQNLITASQTLQQVCATRGHIAVYAPLIINEMGYRRIQNECTGLRVSPTHILTKEYNLFDESCMAWKGDSKLYKQGTELILRKSQELGIPSCGGHHVNDEKGFGAQGLAISFAHGAPDAIPAIFYWKENGWTPLINKPYQR